MKKRRSKEQHFLRTLRWLAFAGTAPGVLCSLWLLWQANFRFPPTLTLSVALLVLWLLVASLLVERTVRPLQTAANLLSALREGDFSVRAHRGKGEDPLGVLYSEINLLGNTLRQQRLSALEATALVTAVMEAIDVAVFAFDEQQLLRLVNPAGQRLLRAPAEVLLGRPAEALKLEQCLEGEPVRVLPVSPFEQNAGAWGLRRCSFREEGRSHTLVVLADLSQALRAEQSKAWQSLVRVLGHELNNSLAPIKSLSVSLCALSKKTKRAEDWETDLQTGLEVIASRAEGLNHFMQAYSRLARLPAPMRTEVALVGLIKETAELETRVPVQWHCEPLPLLPLDAGQIGQVLVNLVKNAAESTLLAREERLEKGGAGVTVALEPHEPIVLTCRRRGTAVLIEVADRGIGLSTTANLFVPFYTTKPGGSGIGLALSRQIAENHGGTLTLLAQPSGPGCVATLSLPLA